MSKQSKKQDKATISKIASEEKQDKEKMPLSSIKNSTKENESQLKDSTPPTLCQPDNKLTEPSDKQNIGEYSNKKKDMRWLWSGLVGASLVIAIMAFVSLIVPNFRVSKYYVYEDPSILNQLLSTPLSISDSINIRNAIKEEHERRNDMIEDLLDEGIIVSSDVFASNLSSYYNALIAVLAAILILLNLFGFFSWRSSANSALEQKQNELDKAINDIDETVENNLEELFRKNLVVKEKLERIVQDLLDEDQKLDEEEWKKLHLLLKRIARKEDIDIINSKETNLDGIIED